MTIFIPEYIIYWSSCPNLFFIDYSPTYVFVIDLLIFDSDGYSALYKTGAFSKSGYVKYPKWIHYNFYKNKGIEILRARMCEKFFLFKKFHVRKIFYQEARYYKYVGFYFWESMGSQFAQLTSTFSFLDLIKDKNYYTETNNIFHKFLHPKKWRWMIAKHHWFVIEQVLRDEIMKTIHFETWDKLCIYMFGGVGKQYWVNLVNLFFYSFCGQSWFEEANIFSFFNSYKFANMYRSLLLMFYEIYIYIDFILLIPIKCYIFYLILHIVYDISFIFFFYNKFMIKLVLEIYNILIGHYTSIIFWLSSIRMFKKTVIGKYYDLGNILRTKQMVLRNYCYKIIRSVGVSKQNEKYQRKLDDCFNYPFILIYLFKYKFQAFIFLERFAINLSYFFNKFFFSDLLKKYYLRNSISFFNFLLVIFIFCPIYVFLNILYHIFYVTSFITFFIKDTYYWYFNALKFEEFYEDAFRNILFDKIFEEKYDYFTYFFHFTKFEHFTWSYYKIDRDRVHNKYSALLKKPRTIRDTPIEDIIFEYWNERNKYAIGSAIGGLKGYKGYLFWNKLAGNYIKYKMYLHDHYFEDPFFFSSCVDHFTFSVPMLKIFRMNLVLNFLKIEYLKKVIIQIKIFFSGFWYYYFFIILFYPIYYVFYFIDFIHFIYLSLNFESYHIILCKIYLNIIILRKFLISFWFISKIVNVILYIYKVLKAFILKLRLYVESNNRFKYISFEVWKFCILFYFYFLRYKFILKIFRIFLVRLWVFGFCLVVLIFFFDDSLLYGFCYDVVGGVSAWSELFWEKLRFIFIDPNYSFFFFFKDILIFDFIDFIRGRDILGRFFYDWSIIHMDWVFYIKAWYKQYIPSVHFVFLPFKNLITFLGLDYKWWLFQIKLWFSMDYGFIRLNIMFEMLKLPAFLYVWKNFYDLLIFCYIYYFFEWFYHYFWYRILCFVDMKLNFLFINEFFIFIFNIFYNVWIIIYYYYNYFIFYHYQPFYIKTLVESADELEKIFPPFFYYFFHLKTIRAYFVYDTLMFIEYYWFYFYHYLYFYSYEYIHNFYNYLIYLINFVYWGNWQYSTYNLIGFYDIFNSYVTMPLLTFFHKFFMFFLNSSYNLNYWQQDYPNINHGFQFPFVISKTQQFTGSTTLNRFFFETWIIKVNILENIFLYGWRYNTRFSSGLFLLSYIYVLIIMFCLIRIFVYGAKSFRQMNVKTRLSQSGARLWYKMRPVESRHLYTDLEYDWVYSWDWIYEFPKYRKEFFPQDPITNLRGDNEINYFEGEYIVYRFLTKLFEYKRNQNKKYVGWKILNNMDSYYNKRYGTVLSVVDTIFTHNIGGLEKQTNMFRDVDYFFSIDYYLAEKNPTWRLYYGHTDRFERYRDIVSYENFLFKVAMPFLYMYCDDVKYIQYYMKNIGKMRTNLWKLETLLNDKEKFRLDFTEFFFTDKQFYEKFISEFQCQDATTVFGAFIEHRSQNVFNFRPWYSSETFTLYKPGIYQRLYKWEDYFLKLTEWDEKYFNNIFNLTFYNTFEWPILMRTKIQLDQLQALFDAFDPFTMLEETQFLPSNSGIIRGDTETDYEIQQRVNHYWTTVIKGMNDDYHNELGLFTTKVMPLFSYLYGIYLPLILVSVQFFDTFNIHSNFLDFLPPLFSYIFSTFGYIDMNFSTWAINDPWFVVNPLMGVFITRDFGIDVFLTFMGQGYQPWILFNIDIPKNYHSSLFIYSFSNVDFYPFEEFFSKWEDSFYFYNVLPLTEKLIDLPQYDFLIEYPFGYDLFHIGRELKAERFFFMPIFNELFGSIIIYFLGFLPRMLAVVPLILLWYTLAFLLYVMYFRDLTNSVAGLDQFHYQIKKGYQYNGLLSKKQK